MQISRVAAVAWLIISTRAQTPSTANLPSCGVRDALNPFLLDIVEKLTCDQRTCIVNSINQQTVCSSTDTSCLCGNSALGYSIGYCLGSTCDSADISTSEAWVEQLCSGSSTTQTTAVIYTAATAHAATASASSKSGGTTYNDQGYADGTSGGGLSTGAKIGIGIGVPLAVFLIGGIFAAFLLGRRRKIAAVGQAPPAYSYAEQQAPVQGPNGFASMSMDPKMAPQASVVDMYPLQSQDMQMSQQMHQQVPQQPIPHPNAFEMQGSMAQSQFNHGYANSGVSPQQLHATPLPTHASPVSAHQQVYEAPTNAPMVTSASELPAA
ncbi:hypothetical protein BT63DRAFT_455647 [Microthyrium microscopicum]|uniref:CFEM domain-containing protein n=1 Tax=Microthyrium microscopicum TaxID=703497 RepID=A0A6A6UCR3_9PEZI|nr:hypothetical protein BT63DRAFT_455647 [Microthyrium microscopicum]